MTRRRQASRCCAAEARPSGARQRAAGPLCLDSRYRDYCRAAETKMAIGRVGSQTTENDAVGAVCDALVAAGIIDDARLGTCDSTFEYS